MWNDVAARIAFSGYTSADETTILGHVQTIYGTSIGRMMIDDFLADPNASISFTFAANNAYAGGGDGTVGYDLAFSDSFYYINKAGVAVQEQAIGTIAHELTHALENLEDNWQGQADYSGDTVTFANTIFVQLGIDEQLSYPGAGSPGDLQLGFNYADGSRLDRAYFTTGDGHWTSTGNYDDLLIGDSRANDLEAGDGHDTVYGAGNEDYILGGNGNDYLDGGTFSDTIYGGAGNDTVVGGNGRDVIYLGSGADVFQDNTQNNSFGHDLVYGYFGNDTILADGGNDTVYGGAGYDSIRGGMGNDQLYGGSYNDTIWGGDGNDTVGGGNGNDLIFLNNGNDVFLDNMQSGTFGNDTVLGGYGNDRITGGGGENLFRGQWGDDTLIGGADDDVLDGGIDDDLLTGGAGADVFRFNAAFNLGTDTISDYSDDVDMFNFLGVTSNDISIDTTASATQISWGSSLVIVQGVTSGITFADFDFG